VLLRAGANANHIDGLGLVVLHQATARASASDIELLLAHGADINSKDPSGLGVIDYAIMDNNHIPSSLFRRRCNHAPAD